MLAVILMGDEVGPGKARGAGMDSAILLQQGHKSPELSQRGWAQILAPLSTCSKTSRIMAFSSTKQADDVDLVQSEVPALGEC